MNSKKKVRVPNSKQENRNGHQRNNNKIYIKAYLVSHRRAQSSLLSAFNGMPFIHSLASHSAKHTRWPIHYTRHLN